MIACLHGRDGLQELGWRLLLASKLALVAGGAATIWIVWVGNGRFQQPQQLHIQHHDHEQYSI